MIFATAQWLTDRRPVLVDLEAAIDKHIEESGHSTGCMVTLLGPMPSEEAAPYAPVEETT